MLTPEQTKKEMNSMGARGVPFLFVTDFEGKRTYLRSLDELSAVEVSYDFNGQANVKGIGRTDIRLEKSPMRIESFALAFNKVVGEINYGNSFLTNLTFETPVMLNASLEEVFSTVIAKYKLRFKDEFVCFSPEIFVQISNDQIRSFPMKGTIDASIVCAEEIILNDPKEVAEHVTIVDLIRNDLSHIAQRVRVERFRYLEQIKTERGKLLQVSSEIVGELDSNWQSNIGNILFSMLPAGSICGAPKPKTVKIIKSAESHKRGFYTGVCGVFDGKSLDSGVMIRFIQKRDGQFHYKSGGGITAFSDLEKEYQEYIDKIYVPVGH